MNKPSMCAPPLYPDKPPPDRDAAEHAAIAQILNELPEEHPAGSSAAEPGG